MYSVTEQEGTIQFAYDLRQPPQPLSVPRAFAAWREILFKLDLIGQQPDLYGGFGYGNLSMRSNTGEFVITASQTSGAERLYAKHLVSINTVNLERFWVDAEGYEPPSSESLTHAMIYQQVPAANWIFHVHNATIWRIRGALGLPETDANTPYGSPAMATAVSQIMDGASLEPQIFATAGHEDGIFACGADPHTTGAALVALLGRAEAETQEQESNCGR